MGEIILDAAPGARLACRFGRHAYETINAIESLEGATWLLDNECDHPRRVGSQWCPGGERRHRHRAVARCRYCGSVP